LNVNELIEKLLYRSCTLFTFWLQNAQSLAKVSHTFSLSSEHPHSIVILKGMSRSGKLPFFATENPPKRGNFCLSWRG